MHEQPSSSVDEESSLVFGEVSISSSQVFDSDLAWGKQVNSGNWPVADGDLSLGSLDVNSAKAIEVGEEGSVRSSHGEFDLGELGKYSEESHLLLHHELLSNSVFGCEHL